MRLGSMLLVGCAVTALGFAACTSEGEGGGTGGASYTSTGSGGDTSCACTTGAYVPVCGVDGAPYNAACGLACVPVEVGCVGACPCAETCANLEADHAAALAAAKGCNGALPPSQCTLLVPDALSCPCDTFANPANTTAFAELEALGASWASAGCDALADCANVVCVPPAAPSCASGATGDGCAP